MTLTCSAVDSLLPLARTRPAFRDDALRMLGARAGQHSIRVNAQWRICFRWTDDGPCDVESVDSR